MVMLSLSKGREKLTESRIKRVPFGHFEQIRLVYGFTIIVRLVRPVQVMKQWFTGRTGRGRMVTCISLAT